MIIDIRGTHGSGKSYIPHKLLEKYDHTDILEKGFSIGYSLPAMDAAIVGRYENACGGCDGIKTADEICRRVRKLQKEFRHVIMEGILVAHTFQRYSELATELGHYNFCFLNTPLEKCIERVKARRLAKGNTKPLDPKNIIGDWHNIWEKVRRKCIVAGHTVIVLDHKNPMPQVRRLLNA